MCRTFPVAILLAASLVSTAQIASSTPASMPAFTEGAGAAALAQLRGLAGEWEGSFEWIGARTATGTVNATYSETGNGSAVVENLAMDGVPAMTSVYRLDGADLRATH